jgi:OOP family OmpA-OmpF porin
MKHVRCILVILLFAAALGLTAGLCAAQEDAEGCKDYPMFSRMKGFYITNCESNFDQAEFYVADGESKVLEGQKTSVAYELQDGAAKPSELQIRRNYVNAVKSLGGSLVFEQDNFATCKLVKNGKEIWFSVTTYNNATSYELVILELGEMTQEVTAQDMLTALNKDGFMALYINFDTGRADIKPESQPIVDQVVALLEENPDLKLSVEGHTDNVGDPAKNKSLSLERAKSVVAALTAKGIAADRLSAVGWGQEKPIADNRSEDGRAKNRRVEIVKR